MKVSRVKIIAFLQPVIAIASGAAAAWLFVNIHVLGIFHVTQSQVASVIASGVVFVVTASLTWLSTHQHLVPITNVYRARMRGLPALVPIIPFTVAEIVAFATPYISVASGALVTWLFVHIKFLGLFHVAQGGVAYSVASAVIFALTSILTWAAQTYHIIPAVIGSKLPMPQPPAVPPPPEPVGSPGVRQRRHPPAGTP